MEIENQINLNVKKFDQTISLGNNKTYISA